MGRPYKVEIASYSLYIPCEVEKSHMVVDRCKMDDVETDTLFCCELSMQLFRNTGL